MHEYAWICFILYSSIIWSPFVIRWFGVLLCIFDAPQMKFLFPFYTIPSKRRKLHCCLNSALFEWFCWQPLSDFECLFSHLSKSSFNSTWLGMPHFHLVLLPKNFPVGYFVYLFCIKGFKLCFRFFLCYYWIHCFFVILFKNLLILKDFD